MTPGQHLAYWSIGVTALALALILAAVITAGHEHKGGRK